MERHPTGMLVYELVNKMGEFFTVFGLVIGILWVDAAICALEIIIYDTKEDDYEWWLCPLITNTIGFAVSLAFHIFNCMK